MFLSCPRIHEVTNESINQSINQSISRLISNCTCFWPTAVTPRQMHIDQPAKQNEALHSPPNIARYYYHTRWKGILVRLKLVPRDALSVNGRLLLWRVPLALRRQIAIIYYARMARDSKRVCVVKRQMFHEHAISIDYAMAGISFFFVSSVPMVKLMGDWYDSKLRVIHKVG